MTNDWTQKAAEEVVEHIADTDNYIASEIRAIIEKHVPFEPEVAYMPIPRCESCRRWTKHPPGAYPSPSGSCDVLRFTSPMGEWHMTTSPDFGCVRWEAK